MLVIALLTVVPPSWVLGTFDKDADARSAEQLLELPSRVAWILGNSIFKTGVDPKSLETQLDGPPVDFEYHGGHYTSLWYPIVTHALPKVDESPDVVVWGFRLRTPPFQRSAKTRSTTLNCSYRQRGPDVHKTR